MKNWMTAATLGMVLSAPIVGHAETAGASQAEVEQLKGLVAALLARVEQLEKAQAPAIAPEAAGSALPQIEERLAAVEESNDRQTDALAQGLASSSAMDWARNIKWKGDLRYRNESFDVEGSSSDRVRDRLRVRFGLEAKVSPTLLVGIEVATGEGTRRALDQFDARQRQPARGDRARPGLCRLEAASGHAGDARQAEAAVVQGRQQPVLRRRRQPGRRLVPVRGQDRPVRESLGLLARGDGECRRLQRDRRAGRLRLRQRPDDRRRLLGLRRDRGPAGPGVLRHTRRQQHLHGECRLHAEPHGRGALLHPRLRHR